MNRRSIVAILAVLIACVFVAAILLRPDDDPSGNDNRDQSLGAVQPLTGLPAENPSERRALVVKIDSHPSISTFPGLQDADLVYEVLVEGGITRYLAMFQSHDVESTGPVRSLRSTDFDITANLGEPAILYSGANDPTEAAADTAGILRYSPGSSLAGSAFTRDNSFDAPHNLFVSTVNARKAISEDGTVEAPFAIGSDAAQDDLDSEVAPMAGLTVSFESTTNVSVRWDPERGEWLRWEDRTPAVDEDGRQLGTANFLVLDTEYTSAPWDPNIPEAISVGSGDGLLLSDGEVRTITWSRSNKADPFLLKSAAGQRVTVPAGRTWVAFAPPGSASELDEDQAAGL